MARSQADHFPSLFFSLDTPSAVPLHSGESYVKGWFVPADGDAYELWLVVGKSRVKAFTGLPRPDVARHHAGDSAFENPGFVVWFKRPESKQPVSLIAVTKAGEITLAGGIPVPDFAQVEGAGTYQRWLAKEEASQFWPENEISARLAALTYRPLMSILLTVPDSHPLCLVTRSVESVLQQHYREWQLCVEARQAPAYFDDRIELVNADAAKGDFVLRLDYRDELHPHALLEIVRSLNEDGPADIIYSDEDEMDFHGSRLRPIFRPAFGNMAAIRRGVALPAAQVRHIPKILYHFRRGDDTAPLPRAPRDIPPRPRRDAVKPQIAVLVRAEDGAFQQAALAPTINRETTRIYELPADPEPAAEVFVFINRPLDTVNHRFFEELAAEAMREDCGVVTGISLDRTGRILHSGLYRLGSEMIDPFEGIHFSQGELLRPLETARTVDAISEAFFFAVKRSRLAAISDLQTRRLVTPYAVATFDIGLNEMNTGEVRELATERNYLRRELALAEETIARLKGGANEELRQQIRELNAELEAARTANAQMQNSLSWKVTSPLRTFMELIRGKS